MVPAQPQLFKKCLHPPRVIRHDQMCLSLSVKPGFIIEPKQQVHLHASQVTVDLEGAHEPAAKLIADQHQEPIEPEPVHGDTMVSGVHCAQPAYVIVH